MTSPDPERLAVSVPEHVVYRDFAEQTVALNLQTGRYHGLNETAVTMLDALREAPTVAAAAEGWRASGTCRRRCCSPTCSSCARAWRVEACSRPMSPTDGHSQVPAAPPGG